MNLEKLNTSPTVKRWVLWVGGLLILALLMSVCLGGSDARAVEVSGPRPDKPESFTVQLTPVSGVSVASTMRCWHFGEWEWENRDGIGRLRFGYGEELTACTDLALRKWVNVQQYDAYHWLGYWQHELTEKNRSQLQLANVYITTLWKFTFKPAGIPLLHEDRTLRCRLQASNHTAYCTLFH
jgi:hypothetical protein